MEVLTPDVKVHSDAVLVSRFDTAAERNKVKQNLVFFKIVGNRLKIQRHCLFVLVCAQCQPFLSKASHNDVTSSLRSHISIRAGAWEISTDPQNFPPSPLWTSPDSINPSPLTVSMCFTGPPNQSHESGRPGRLTGKPSIRGWKDTSESLSREQERLLIKVSLSKIQKLFL